MNDESLTKDIHHLGKKEKQALIKKHSPHSKHLRNTACAFAIGGVICLLGELERQLLPILSGGAIDERTSPVIVSLTFVVLSAILTAIGIFDNLARVGGAGTLVPITGFANAVVSEAIDSRSEGFVLGVGAKIFTVAGPVILYGTVGGILYGIIYYICNLLFL